MRFRSIAVSVNIAFALILAGLVFTQIIKGPCFKDLSENNRIRLVPIKGPRGVIYDRNQQVLVESRPSFNIAVVPQEIRDKDELFNKIADTIKKNDGDLQARFKKGYIAPFAPVVLAQDVDKKAAIIVEENRVDTPGIIVQIQPIRHYVHSGMACHLFGYLGQIDKYELIKLREYGYKIKDLIGRCGVEKAYDGYLRGEDGGMQIEVDNKGRLNKILGFKEPQKGMDIVLTIDLRMQKILHQLLSGHKGAAVILDPHTGEILALESSPSFDSNIFIEPDKEKEISRVLIDSRKPLLNRAISGLYPPGSIFKIITTAAAMETGKLSQNSQLSCSGRYFLGKREFKCWNQDGHGLQRINWALANSCNVFFYQVGRMLGPDNIASYASLFGVGKLTDIDLPGENKGLLPTRLWMQAVKHMKWHEGNTLNYAIGQGDLLVTPLQMAKMVSCIANGGCVVTPFVVKKIGDKEVASAKVRKIKISNSTIDVIKDGMRKAVNEPGATANRACIPGADIAAKTGTAQAGKGETHAWIVGFYPADKPKISFVVFLEHGGSGGAIPAEIVRGLIEQIRKDNII